MTPETAGSNSRHIVLGVCGGVAAYKAVEICRRLMDAGHRVSPILTSNATRFVGPATFSAIASEPARVDLWTSPEPSPHTTLGQSADLILVAPATARLLGAYAHGLSDDLLTTTLLATRSRVIVCPAMHTEMWEHPAVQDNLAILRSRGVLVVEPESGHLAGGDTGVGRLASTESILAAVEEALSPVAQELLGRRILITAGGTREPIDPVRFLGNRSSGRQGHALAAVAAARGAKVTLVTTAAATAPAGVDVIAVDTADQMHRAVRENFDGADALIMAAAVADYRPRSIAPNKLKKQDGVPAIELEPTVDILSDIASVKKPSQIVVGFAAETDNIERGALDKLRSKRLDLIVLNDVMQPGAGFEHKTNEVHIYDSSGTKTSTGLVSKEAVAAAVLDSVAKLFAER